MSNHRYATADSAETVARCSSREREGEGVPDGQAMKPAGSRFPVAFRLGRLGRNTIYATTGLGLRAVIQAGYLLAMSRWLGAAGYGMFAGSVALAVLVSPLANWGSPLLLTRHIARDRGCSRALWATALLQTAITGGLLSLAMLALSAWLLHDDVGPGPMCLLVLSELVLLPAAQAATSLCFALERGFASALAMCLVPAGRLLAVVALIVAGVASNPGHAALAHFIGSLAGLAVAVLLVAVLDGWPDWRKRLRLAESTQQGTAYALGGVVGTSYQEIDKVLMLQMLGAAIVGPYTVAFRVISIFALPVSALIGATLPRLMALHGVPGQVRTFRAVCMAALGYGCVASLTALLVAPLIPLLFGAGYAEAVKYVVLFSPWPLLFALHQCVATQLTASDRQGVRVLVEGAGLLLVAVLNLLLLPRMGAEASVGSLLLAEVGMVIGCWVAIRSSRSRRG